MEKTKNKTKKSLTILLLITTVLILTMSINAQTSKIMEYNTFNLYSYNEDFTYDTVSQKLNENSNQFFITDKNNQYGYYYKNTSHIQKIQLTTFEELENIELLGSITSAENQMIRFNEDETEIYYVCSNTEICVADTDNLTLQRNFTSTISFIGTLYYYDNKIIIGSSGTSNPDTLQVYNAETFNLIHETNNLKWTGTTNAVKEILFEENDELYIHLRIGSTSRVYVMDLTDYSFNRNSGNLGRIYTNRIKEVVQNFGQNSFFIVVDPEKIQEVYKNNLTIKNEYELETPLTLGALPKLFYINEDNEIIGSHYYSSSTNNFFKLNVTDISTGYFDLTSKSGSLPSVNVFPLNTTQPNEEIYDGLVCRTNNDNVLICYDEDAVCFPQGEKSYLCENVFLLKSSIGIETYCDIENLTFCSGGCENTQLTNEYDVSYTSGICSSDVTCSNECDVEGLRYSDTSTTYKKCEFDSTNTCLVWSDSYNCVSGEYSIDGFCENIESVNNTYYTKNSFQMIPHLLRTTTYSVTGTNPFVRLETSNDFVTQGFQYTPAFSDYYVYQNCNYEETSIYEETEIEYTNNDSITHTFNGYTNGVTTVNFELPTSASEINFVGVDNNDDYIYNVKVKRNETLGVCLINNFDNETIGCNTLPTGFTNELNFRVQTITSFNAYSTSYNVEIVGSQVNKNIYTGFYNTLSEYLYTDLVISSDENLTINEVSVYNGEQFIDNWKSIDWLIYMSNDDEDTYLDTILRSNVFTSLYNVIAPVSVSNYFSEVFEYYKDRKQNVPLYRNPCVYTNVGEYKVRSYYAKDLSENGFWNYKEYNVFVDGLGETTRKTQIESRPFEDMNPRVKLFTALIVIFLLFGLSVTIGYFVDYLKIFTFIGVFLTVGFAGYFSIIGWLPVWLIIIMFVLSSISIAVLIRGAFTND